jgi:HK97 gp10 family phage protein
MQATLHGLPGLLKELQRLGSAAQGRVARNMAMAGARVVAKHARALAPVKTGRLKRSIKARRGRTRVLTPGAAIAFANASARHSWLVEYGTSRQPARSYLRRALDESAVEIRHKMVENLTNGLQREIKRQQVLEDLGEI